MCELYYPFEFPCFQFFSYFSYFSLPLLLCSSPTSTKKISSSSPLSSFPNNNQTPTTAAFRSQVIYGALTVGRFYVEICVRLENSRLNCMSKYWEFFSWYEAWWEEMVVRIVLVEGGGDEVEMRWRVWENIEHSSMIVFPIWISCSWQMWEVVVLGNGIGGVFYAIRKGDIGKGWASFIILSNFLVSILLLLLLLLLSPLPLSLPNHKISSFSPLSSFSNNDQAPIIAAFRSQITYGA